MSTKTLVAMAVTAAALVSQLVATPYGGQGRGGGFTQPDPIAFDDHDGWTSIFDGASLRDWDGNLDIWRLENGAIVGESTREKPSGTTYIIWKGGEPLNFELKAEMKLDGIGLNLRIDYRTT